MKRIVNHVKDFLRISDITKRKKKTENNVNAPLEVIKFGMLYIVKQQIVIYNKHKSKNYQSKLTSIWKVSKDHTLQSQ